MRFRFRALKPKQVWVAAFVASNGVFATPLSATKLSVTGINAAIHSQGQQWQAGNTSVSQLSLEEMKRLTGIPAESIEVGEDYGHSNSQLAAALPEVFDWRNHEGVNYVSPVKNQGRCGSCVAFAAVSTMESQFNLASSSATHPWSFSPQHLFACGGGACDGGWQPSFAVDFLNTDGVPDAACFPYHSGALGEDAECQATCIDAKQRSFKADVRVRSKPILGASIEDIKTALLGGPLMGTMRVYEDFYYYKSGVYKHVQGGVVGGHAVTLVGWSNADEAWIVRNSWGTDWGMNGDFMISWKDRSGTGATFFGLQPTQRIRGVFLEGIRDRDFVYGAMNLKFQAQGIAISEAKINLATNSRMVATLNPGEAGTTILDTAQWEDGVYTVRAEAKDAAGTVYRSQPYLFFINNRDTTASLAIKGIKENMNVWDSIVAQFEITSHPVPVALVRYRMVNDAGNTVYTRSAPHTADTVGISLKAGNLPVGHYTMVGEALNWRNEVLATDHVGLNITEK